MELVWWACKTGILLLLAQFSPEKKDWIHELLHQGKQNDI